jgi:hypothetical protein
VTKGQCLSFGPPWWNSGVPYKASDIERAYGHLLDRGAEPRQRMREFILCAYLGAEDGRILGALSYIAHELI